MNGGEHQVGALASCASESQAMKQIAVDISEQLVSIYNSVEVVESRMFKRVRGLGVTMSEARIIQLVGDETFHTNRSITISQLAARAYVSVPTMTSGVNRLVDRGFLIKQRCQQDGRCINVSLTRKGEEVFRIHTIFHVRMATAVMEGMSLEEMQTFREAIQRLADFYRTEEQR